MQLELKNEEGKIIGTIEVPVEQLRENLNLSDSSKSEAKLAEVEPQLKESQDKVARLEEENTRLKSPEAKARWLQEFMTPENFAVVATKMGYELPEATEAEVAEHGEELEPTIIQGKTDKPGFRYLPNIDMSIKEEAQEEGE